MVHICNFYYTITKDTKDTKDRYYIHTFYTSYIPGNQTLFLEPFEFSTLLDMHTEVEIVSLWCQKDIYLSYFRRTLFLPDYNSMSSFGRTWKKTSQRIYNSLAFSKRLLPISVLFQITQNTSVSDSKWWAESFSVLASPRPPDFEQLVACPYNLQCSKSKGLLLFVTSDSAKCQTGVIIMKSAHRWILLSPLQIRAENSTQLTNRVSLFTCNLEHISSPACSFNHWLLFIY